MTDRRRRAAEQPTAAADTQLIRQLTDAFGRQGLHPGPDHVKAVAEYHRRWTKEMAALRLRLEQLVTSSDDAGASDRV